MRITVACPDALRGDANNLAMALAFGPADELTYDALNWQDAAGNLYAAASFEVEPEWVLMATSFLTRPAWDVEPYKINMLAASHAQASIVLWAGTGELPKASVSTLTAIAGMQGVEALEAMGLTTVP
jgi:hypothetical protein